MPCNISLGQNNNHTETQHFFTLVSTLELSSWALPKPKYCDLLYYQGIREQVSHLLEVFLCLIPFNSGDYHCISMLVTRKSKCAA